jgi:hypothetical protein
MSVFTTEYGVKMGYLNAQCSTCSAQLSAEQRFQAKLDQIMGQLKNEGWHG